MTTYLHSKLDISDPELASAYDEAFLWSARFGELLFQHLELRRNVRVLDLGCGTGFPLFELAHMLGASCELVGVDVWREALERAQLKLRVYGLQNVELVEADARALPFPNASFDVIVSNLGVNNFTAPEAVLAECFRVAKDEATIALTSNVTGHMREFYQALGETLTELQKTRYLERLAIQEAHRGTKDSLRRLLEEAGFKTTKLIEELLQMRYLDGSAFFNHWLTRLGFLDGWRSVVEPEDEEIIFERVEAKLNQQAKARGELRVTVPMLYIEGKKEGRKPGARH